MPSFQYEVGSTDIEDRVARLEDSYKFMQSLISGWVGVGTDPHFNSLSADNARFSELGFLGTIGLQASGTTVPNNAWSALNWNGDLLAARQTNDFFSWSSINSSVITVAYSLDDLRRTGLLFLGQVGFAASSAGLRAVSIIDPDGVGIVMARVRATSGGTTILPFCLGRTPVTGDNDYRIRVYQNSGSSMAVTGTLYVLRFR